MFISVILHMLRLLLRKCRYSESLASHTLSIGSNLYVDDIGSNVLVVTGNVSVTGNLTINGGTTLVKTDNLIVKDPLIEIGQNNIVNDTSLDLGLIMSRPESNIVVGYREVSDEFVIAYTESSASSNTITPISSEDLDVHIYGGVWTESNVGIKTTSPDAELHVVGNVYATSNLTVDTDTFHVDAENDHVGVNTKNPDAELHVVGNVYASANLTVDTDTFHVDAENDHVGINTKNPDAELHVVGNVYVSSNLSVDTDTFHVDVEADHVGINTKNPDAELHVVGNVYVSSNLSVDTDTFHVDVEADHVGINTKNPDAELHVVGNVYATANLTIDTDTFHVDAENDSIGVGTVNPKANLHVVGNVYATANLTVDTDTFHVDAENDSIGVGTVNPKANLHVVGNVYATANLTVDTDTFHVDAENDSVGIGTKNPTSNLHVVGNTYVSSNTTTDGTLTINHPTTAILTDLNANVEIKLNQLANVVIDTTDVDESLRADHVLVYNGVNWVNEYPIHNYIRIYNNSGSTLYAGNSVYIVGHHNANLVEVGLASASSASTMPSIGVVYNTSINQGDQGVAVAYGKVNSIDTTDFLEGDTLYVSNVGAGLLSNVKPYNTNLDLIQNIGVCTRSHETSGAIFVTGVGRANDIPNAQIVADESDINYVYVNDQNNDLKKILPSGLLTQLQTFEQVSAAGNVVSNIMSFTNAYTSVVTTSNINVGGNISVTGLIDSQKKYLTMVNQDGFFEQSPVYVDKDSGVYVIEAAEAEFLGNLTLSGNTTILNSENVTISDRIFGVAANNSASQLDSGFMIEHQEGDPLEYANVALIYHADEHRFSISYTQNTFIDNHILHYDDGTHRMLIDFYGNVEVQNNLVVNETLNVVSTSTLTGDITVGGTSLVVDVSESNVGVNTATPLRNLDVNGDARVQSTTDTDSTSGGALTVLGGLGVASNIHSTNVYAGSHVGIGTISTTRPVHVMANSAGAIYVNGSGNDARVGLEATGTTADPVVSFNVNGGEAFSVGIDNSLNDTFNIANHASDVGTNARLTMTPAGITTITNATDATSTTDGALIVSGGLGVAKSIHAVTVRGTTLTGTNLYGTLAGANTAAVTDLTASAMVKGVTITGTNLYGTLAGANTAAVTDLTATDMVKGTTITGTNLYGTLAGANTAAVTDLTASAMVKGVTITGTNLYGTLAGANTAAVTDLTATDMVKGTTITGTNLYGTLAGANTAAVTDLTASAMVKGVTLTGTNLYGTLAGANTAAVTDLTASAMVKGVTITGTNLYGTLAGANTAAVTTLTASDTTASTSSATGAITSAGGVGIVGNVHVDANVYVAGGLITNTGGVTKKTYSFSNIMPSGVAPQTNVVFTSNVFYAKITATLVDKDEHVSTMLLDVNGGSRTGAVNPGSNVITVGTKSIFGTTDNTVPWSSTVSTTSNVVTIVPSGNMTVDGNCHIFVEYTSFTTTGGVEALQHDNDTLITFGY
jgi:hypothetical protein